MSAARDARCSPTLDCVPFGAVFVSSIIVLSALNCLTPPAQAQGPKYSELLKRIPDQANALMFVDVEGLMQSPLGKRENWAGQLADRPSGSLGVSLDARRFAVATSVDPRTLDERWKLGMLESKSDLPSPSSLATREGGYVEEIETQKVVWTPRDFYLFTFEPNVIGFAVPADRQLLVQFIASTLAKPRTFPPGWADRALYRADHGSQVVLALNLEHVLSPREVEAWLKAMPAVAEHNLDASILAGKLASVNSAFLQVDVTESIRGTIHVDFDQEGLEYAAPILKQVILETLNDVGAQLGTDIATWSANVKGKTVELEGRLEENALRRILSMASAPRLTQEYSSTATNTSTAPANSAPPAAPKEPSTTDVATASQRYFRSIVDITDAIRQQRNQDWTHIRFWMDRSAREIDELPILFVDNDLLDWGAQVSKTLREMSYGINYVNKDRQYRLASSPKGSYVGYWGGYGGTYAGADDRLMRTQSNSMISTGIDGSWKSFENSVGEMRRAMVQKYMIDF